MSKIIVGIGELAIGAYDDTLITMNLGSCVGIALYDSLKKVGGLAHIRLYNSKFFFKDTDVLYAEKAGQFPDTAIPKMVELIVKIGGVAENLTAKVFGGGFMFKASNFTHEHKRFMDVGSRNLRSTFDILAIHDTPIVAEETGGNIPRTIEFSLESGVVRVKTAGMEDRLL